MNEAEHKATEARPDESVVLMYPDNNLKEQVRDFDQTMSVFQVVKDTFFTEKR